MKKVELISIHTLTTCESCIHFRMPRNSDDYCTEHPEFEVRPSETFCEDHALIITDVPHIKVQANAEAL